MYKNIKQKFRNYKSKITKKRVIIIGLILSTAIFLIKREFNDNDSNKTSVQRGKVQETLILSGNVNASLYTHLTFAGSGKIDYIGVKEGDIVSKGQLLAKLDLDNLNADYQIAKSNLRDKEAALSSVYDSLKDKDKTILKLMQINQK